MNKICEIKFGSHLYGTNTPESDLDFKAIYIPTAREIVLGNYKETINTQRKKEAGERNTKDDIDIETVSLDRYLELLCDGQTMGLDILFAPKSSYSYVNPELAWIMDFVFENRHQFLNRNVNSFVGYARQQAAKYGIKGSRMDALKSVLDLLGDFHDGLKLLAIESELKALVDSSKELVSLEKTPLIQIVDINAPNGRLEPHLHVSGRKIPFHATVKYAKQIFEKIYANYGARAHKANLSGGKDYKALSHAVRVNSEAKELLLTGFITFPRPDRELLLRIKTADKNGMPFDEISEIIESGLAELSECQESSILPEASNLEFAQDFIYRVYSEIVKKG